MPVLLLAGHLLHQLARDGRVPEGPALNWPRVALIPEFASAAESPSYVVPAFSDASILVQQGGNSGVVYNGTLDTVSARGTPCQRRGYRWDRSHLTEKGWAR